jgi:hypothetical protein
MGLFESIDANKDGRISKVELNAHLSGSSSMQRLPSVRSNKKARAKQASKNFEQQQRVVKSKRDEILAQHNQAISLVKKQNADLINEDIDFVKRHNVMKAQIRKEQVEFGKKQREDMRKLKATQWAQLEEFNTEHATAVKRGEVAKKQLIREVVAKRPDVGDLVSAEKQIRLEAIEQKQHAVARAQTEAAVKEAQSAKFQSIKGTSKRGFALDFGDNTKIELRSNEQRREEHVKKIKDKMLAKISSGKTVAAMFRHFDDDGDGSISKVEFHRGLHKLNLGLIQEDLDHIFARLDIDGDRRIDLNELQHFLDGPDAVKSRSGTQATQRSRRSGANTQRSTTTSLGAGSEGNDAWQPKTTTIWYD